MQRIREKVTIYIYINLYSGCWQQRERRLLIFTSSASSVREGMSSVLFVCLVRQINRTDDIPSLTPLAQLMNITSLLTVCLSPGLLYGKSDQPISLKLGSYDWAYRWVRTKNDFTFWLVFGLSPNSGKSRRKTNSKNVKWPNTSSGR